MLLKLDVKGFIFYPESFTFEAIVPLFTQSLDYRPINHFKIWGIAIPGCFNADAALSAHRLYNRHITYKKVNLLKVKYTSIYTVKEEENMAYSWSDKAPLHFFVDPDELHFLDPNLYPIYHSIERATRDYAALWAGKDNTKRAKSNVIVCK